MEYVKEIRVTFMPFSGYPEDSNTLVYNYSIGFNNEVPVKLAQIDNGMLHIFNEQNFSLESYQMTSVISIVTFFYKEGEE